MAEQQLYGIFINFVFHKSQQ